MKVIKGIIEIIQTAKFTSTFNVYLLYKFLKIPDCKILYGKHSENKTQ